ncbi:MAG: RecQ family ATP-dependent DNA helicase [Clostridia bacterium]|nr:RecQ family ATP-dependent DNA helicase [Clostridia bacterium]
MLNILKNIFGYNSFRPGQREIVENLTNGRDVLAVMPTGAGKSICYQVPALKAEGITIVVSPLISLMIDQVRNLIQCGVRAAYLNSSLTQRQYFKALENAKNYTYKIIYVAPERLLSDSFLAFAKSVNISIVAIDEAHCISQWGQDFRPSYLNIKDFINALPKRPIVGAFTATATERVKEDIIKGLELYKPYCLTTGYDRKNLFFAVKRPYNKMDELIKTVKAHREDSGIIYCISRKTVNELEYFLSLKGYKAAKYHAGLGDDERKNNQESFIQGSKNIMVATNAFGMGIDKPDVRYVLHYNMPMSMEAYYQEAGRAGRDGKAAQCIMLYSPQDYKTNEFLINLIDENEILTQDEKNDIKAKDMYKLDKMRAYALSKRCLREYILNYFGERSTHNCKYCSNCVRRGHITGYTSSQDRELFVRLKAITAEIAKHEHIPAYSVLNDSVLMNMAVKRPKNLDEMKTVEGMGSFKIKRYGEIYLRIIKED